MEIIAVCLLAHFGKRIPGAFFTPIISKYVFKLALSPFQTSWYCLWHVNYRVFPMLCTWDDRWLERSILAESWWESQFKVHSNTDQITQYSVSRIHLTPQLHLPVTEVNRLKKKYFWNNPWWLLYPCLWIELFGWFSAFWLFMVQTQTKVSHRPCT